MNKKILIVVPSFQLMGGVSFHFMGLSSHWSSQVKYATIGMRPHIPAVFCLIPDFILYVLKLIFFNPDVVVINPPFYNYTLKRDGVYLQVARLFGKPVVAMFHGCNEEYAKKQEQHADYTVKQYNKCAFLYSLGQEFTDSLRRMGITVPILSTSTEVNDELVEGFDVAARKGMVRNILYLARLDKYKGIFETIDAFALLEPNYPNLVLNICGGCNDKDFEDKVHSYVEKAGLKNVRFHGKVFGEDKIRAFKENDLYILPTYSEGMATSVLEAMAFGLPVISRPVGGVRDFFKNGEMGWLIESFNPKDYAEKIECLILDSQLCLNMSRTNYSYANSHFLASAVAAKFESDIDMNCMK